MKINRIAVVLAAGALLAPATAEAHISLHPNTIPEGAFATVDARIPGEEEGAFVRRVAMRLPAGFTGVDYANVPGWTTKVIETKLSTPIHQDGETISSEVSEIVWTWIGPAGKVEDGQFINFPLSIAMPEKVAGQALLFPTVQTYSNGKVIHWIESSLTAEHPSPRVNMTAAGGVIEDVAGDEAGPQAGQTGSPTTAAATTPATSSATGASKGLGIAALILGALGLIAGLAALAASRRNGTDA